MRTKPRIFAWVAAIMAALALVVGGVTAAIAAVGNTPAHTKTLTDNHDGTYTLALNVTGESEKKVPKVNVIVIVDRSNSMDTRTGGYTSPTRLAATKTAVNNLASTLLSYNGKEGNPNDTVQMALVTFASTAQTNIASTTSSTTFTDAVNSISTPGGWDGGTNWEAALQQASTISFGDEDPTFVIFFSDGSPTFRNTRNGWNDRDNQAPAGVYGSGQEQEPNMERAYSQATDEAEALATKVGVNNFYTIFAYGTEAGANYMTSLTTAAGSPSANNYSASDTSQLNAAFEEILDNIRTAGFAEVEIDDGTTNQVTTTSGPVKLLEVDESSYKYWRAGGGYGTGNDGLGTKWTNTDNPAPPAAQLVNGEVQWDLSDLGVLENGVTYTVTFDVYPSQYTYDTIAKLKNGDITYASLDSEVKKYIVDGSYSLRTNTNATLTWDDTRDDEGQQTDSYTNPDPVATSADSLPIEKKWEGGKAPDGTLPITVMMDETEVFHTAELSAGTGWSTSTFISVGIIKNNIVLPGAEGHDFSFAELDDTQYRWELDAPTVRPMLINGGGDDHTPTMLIKVDDDHPLPSGATTYTIGGSTYYVDSASTSLTATNHRRSNLNLTKVVTGEDAPEDATFPFTLTVNNSKAPKSEPADDSEHNSDYWVWLSIQDAEGNTVTNPTISGATSGGGGYYYAPSGTAISVEMEAGWNLRFTNLPSGTTYTFVEGDLEDGFEFKAAKLTSGTDSTFSGGKTTTGTIEDTQTSYYVEYTNDYALTDLEITKVWEDADNQDGIRPTAEEFAAMLTLDPAVEGKTPTVVVDPEDSNKYIITYTGLPRFNNGQEVTYTVTEDVPEGYTPEETSAGDHGTITNPHTPEETSVTVVKVWEDSDDIGKIRPASINAQLTADGVASGDPVALNADNKWTYTWENLPKYKDGKAIEYSADETAVPAGYDKTGPEKSTAEDGTVTFTVTNTYNPTPVSVDPPVQKVITGNDDLYNKGDFTFTIEAVNPTDAPMPENTSITNSADYELEGKTGFYKFGEITFTKPGTYTYLVKESGSVPGVTNDPAGAEGKTLTFTVTDDGTGKLAVSPTTDQVQLSFTNVYNADGEASIVVSKEITGAAWPAGKTLTLTIAGADGAPMPEATTATLSAAGSVTFGPIAYGLADAGKSYEYTITESSFGAGWSGSPASVTATVAVNDNGDGTLGTTVTYSPEDAKFTNTYKASGKATLEVEKKLEGAAWPEGKTLTMTLAGQDGAPMPAEGGESVELTAAGKATFGEIAYTEADAGKTYTYKISEGNGFGAGWTGSGDVTATVVVTDNGDGTLATKVTYDPESDTITNTYKATGEIELFAGKKLDAAEGLNAPNVTGKYTLTLEAQDGTPMPEGATDGKVEIKNADGDGTMTTFGKIAFTEADAGKTYTYKVTEAGTVDGVENGTTEYTVTVTVTDNGDGKLTATASPNANTLFTNTYKVKPTTVEFPVKKVLSVPAGLVGPAEWKYTIDVKAEDGAPEADTMTGTVDQDNDTVTFGEFEYTEPGTYTYTVTETGTIQGVTNDGEAITGKTVTVTVVDSGDGTLKATADSTENNPVTFTNTYDVVLVTISFPVEKELIVPEGLEGPAEWEYTIDVKAEDGAPEADTMTGTVDQDNDTVTFGEFEYTEPGTYTYTVTETGTIQGVTNDGEAITGKTVTVTVVDNGDGTMTATASSTTANPVKFTNKYKTEPAKLELLAAKILKVLEPANTPPDVSGKYTITIEGSNGAPMPPTESFQNVDGNGTEASFGEIEFITPGEYQYTISEEGTVSGVTNGTASYTVKIKVTDKGNGTLSAEIIEGKATTTFTNTYSVEPVTLDKGFEVAKILNGTPLTGGAFKFELKDADGKVIQTKTNGDDGKVNFDTITYDTPGTYTYTITEVDGYKGGYTYDTHTVNVTVTVSDNSEGKLVAEVSYEGDTTIVNDYAASGKVYLSVNKELNGRTLEEGQFTFELVDDATGEVIQTKTNDASGAVEFDAIEYDQSIFDAEESEETSSDDTTTVETTADESSSEETDDSTLEGQSDEAVDVESDATETEAEAAPEATDESDASTEEETETILESLAESTGLSDLFGPTTAQAAENDLVAMEAGRFKEYTYTIREVNDGKPGYTYDEHEVKVTVKVVDDDEGNLTATPTYDGSTTFVNTYKASGSATVEGIKTVEGTELKEGQFSFTLTPMAGATGSEQTVTNAVDGSFTFEAINYTEADAGKTYEYQITEENDGQTGYTYDTSVYVATVEISDNGDGTLSCTVSYGDVDSITFNNPYKPLVTYANITAKKTLNGSSLKAGQFTFTLTGADGAPMPASGNTATNNADGSIVFGDIEFDEVGTYTYTITEVAGTDKNMKYDSSTKTVTVDVVDEDGQLVATVNGGGNSCEFVNTYTPPTNPPKKPSKKVLPKTSDPMAASGIMYYSAIGTASLLMGLKLRRRKNHK